MPKRLFVGLLVLWASVSLLGEARNAMTSWDARAEWNGREWGWRFGIPAVARLERCLEPARRLVPPGSIVAFAALGEPRETALSNLRWAAYLMPAQNVLAHDDAAAAIVAQYVIAYDVPLQAPGITKLRQLPGCILYQVNQVNRVNRP